MLDVAMPAVYAPVNDAEAITSWNSDECYWSSSYADAREKFVAMGNALRTQLQQADGASKNAMDLVDVRSASYDVFVENDGTTEPYENTQVFHKGELQPAVVGQDTVDVLVLTMRVDPAQSEKLNIICSSGTHGDEDYAGSAIQLCAAAAVAALVFKALSL